MTWQRIGMGLLVAAGLATTGTVVWVSHRPQVHAIDMITVMQGTMERCWATQYADGSNCWSANRYADPGWIIWHTNKVHTWGSDDPSGLFWVEVTTNTSSTNTFNTNFYKTVSSTALVPTGHTNFLHDGGAGSWYFPFQVTPDLNFKVYHCATSNKYIWGPYTNYEFSGFSSANWNGTYIFVGRTGDVDEYWKNGTNTYRLLDRGPRSGQRLFDPSLVGDWLYDPDWSVRPGYGSCLLVDLGGTIYYWTDADGSARFGQWRSLYHDSDNPDAVEVVASGLITQLVRDAWIITEEVQDNVVDWTTAGTHGALNDGWTYSSDSTFSSMTNKLIACRSLYASTNQTIEGASNIVTVTNMVFTRPGGILASTNLQQVNDACVLLAWTKPSYLFSYWIGGETNYIGSGSGPDWETAKANCATNWDNYWFWYPKHGTAGTFDGTNYHAYFYSHRNKSFISGLYTGVTHSAEFYVKAKALNGKTFDAQGDDVLNGVWHMWDSNSSAATNRNESTVFLGSLAMPAWCSAPSVSNDTALGWETDEYCTILKWSFNYCTE